MKNTICISIPCRLTMVLLSLLVVATFLPSCGGGGKEPTTTPVTPTTSQPTKTTSTAPTTSLPATTTTPTKPSTASLPFTTSNVISGKLDEDNLKVSGGGVSIEVSPVCLDEEAVVTIVPVENMLINNELPVKAYDFGIDTNEELAGLINLTIPYDKNQLPAGANPAENVGACYYNKALKVWEPVSYEIDSTAGNIIITTDHLSVYGAFIIGKEFTRAAYVSFTVPSLAVYAARASSTYADVVAEAISQDMVPGPSALELGNDIVSSWFNFSGAGLTLLTNTVYSTDFLTGIGSAMTNLGLLSAVAQVAIDYQKGDNLALYFNLIKNLSYFSVSKFGSAFLQLSSVGVFCIDYALSTFANEAISGRRDIYQEAYRLYYASEGKRSAKEWYNLFMPMARTSQTATELNQKVMAAIDSYCWKFWENELTVAAYQEMAMAHGFTGGGGLNLSIQNEISNNKKFELLQTTLQPVFNNIARKLSLEQENLIKKELDTIAKEFNQIVTIQVFDSSYDNANLKPVKAVYAGYIARIAPLSDSVTDKEKWQQEITKEGKASLPFRILGHIMAGSPNKVEIVDPENDEVIKEVEFVVTPPTIRLDIADSPAIENIVYASANTNSIPGNSVREALRAAETINISKDGTFYVEVPYASATYKQGTMNWTITVTDFVMTGTWDNTTKKGTAHVSCTINANGIAKDSFDDDPDMQKHYVKTVMTYSLSLSGSATFSCTDDQFIIKVKSTFSPDVTSLLYSYTFIKGEWKAGENPSEGYPDILKRDYSGTNTWTINFDII